MTKLDKGYNTWLKEIKAKIHSSQIKAAFKVNAELLGLYWHLGKQILEKEGHSDSGKMLVDQLSKDLLYEFPQIKGFSRANLYHIRQWVLFYTQKRPIVQQRVGFSSKVIENQPNRQDVEVIPEVLAQIPWGHHLHIISKCKRPNEAIFYLSESAKNNWSRNTLAHQIKSKLWQRKAITNFQKTLPAIQSDLARELIKDPYSFDFLNLGPEHKERELETALIENLVKFLLELGAGFSFIGRQFPITVGNKEFSIDLLFYHYKLRCFVVIELKVGDFTPEYAGKLNFYINVVDDTMRHKDDNPTIGFLICANRDQVVTEYSLRGINSPIGVSEYQLTNSLPENLRGCLPSNKQISDKLTGVDNGSVPA